MYIDISVDVVKINTDPVEKSDDRGRDCCWDGSVHYVQYPNPQEARCTLYKTIRSNLITRNFAIAARPSQLSWWAQGP